MGIYSEVNIESIEMKKTTSSPSMRADYIVSETKKKAVCQTIKLGNCAVSGFCSR